MKLIVICIMIKLVYCDVVVTKVNNDNKGLMIPTHSKS